MNFYSVYKIRSWHGFSINLSNMQPFLLLYSTMISFAICLSILFCIVHRDGIASAQLTGSQETCDAEDESIAVADLPNMKCFDCTCKNGFVECTKKHCPSVDGCYMIQDVQNDECCPKCKGCINDDEHHESGTEWIEPKNPCKLFTCLAGVITESSIRCYTPCKNPIPPRSGQCCATCPDCRVNGRKISTKTAIMPKKDPCVSCNCSEGKLTCTKKACPVLNCPESKIFYGFEECCPQCLGSDKLMDPPKGACLLGTVIHKSGTQFTLDDCTHCTCKNSTVLCERKSCPILECNREHPKILPDQCCAQCIGMENEDEDVIEYYDKYGKEDKTGERKIKNGRSCIYADNTYKNGELWNTTSCESCSCLNGKINCTAIMCPAIICPSNTILKIDEGECCPTCVKSQGVCTMFGGSHIRTFDGKMYAFIGSCKYQLASDCDSGTFNIRLKNIVTGNDATIKRISLKLGNIKIDLQQNKNTKVNDHIVDLPYRLENKLTIVEGNENIAVTSEIGINVHWDYLGFLEVTIPDNYRKQLCGLCGNFNSVANDDMTTREGILVEDPAILAQSWTTGDEVCLDTRKYGVRGCHPQRDQRLCNYIRGSVFERCLKKINVTSYYETCMKDMCECPLEDLQCHCESFTSYVYDCQKLGIMLSRWQKSVGC